MVLAIQVADYVISKRLSGTAYVCRSQSITIICRTSFVDTAHRLQDVDNAGEHEASSAGENALCAKAASVCLPGASQAQGP